MDTILLSTATGLFGLFLGHLLTKQRQRERDRKAEKLKRELDRKAEERRRLERVKKAVRMVSEWFDYAWDRTKRIQVVDSIPPQARLREVWSDLLYFLRDKVEERGNFFENLNRVSVCVSSNEGKMTNEFGMLTEQKKIWRGIAQELNEVRLED